MMDEKMKAAFYDWLDEFFSRHFDRPCAQEVAEWTLDYLRSQQEPVAHRLHRKNYHGEFVPCGQHWNDGPPSAPLVQDASRKDDYRLEVSFAHPIPSAPAVPDGWKLVPIEPTPEMLDAADAADREYTDRCFGAGSELVQQGAYDHWCAMVAAAPSPTEKES